MPQWLQNISGVHIIILISIASSLWGVVAKAVKEKAEKRRVEIARREREENMMRRGQAEPMARVEASMPSNVRPAPAQQLDPRRMLEEIAGKRQAQLEELRRKQLSQAPTNQPRPVARPASVVMQPPPPPPQPARSQAGATMRSDQYEQMKRRQAQSEAARRQPAARPETGANAGQRAKKPEQAGAHEAMLRERQVLEQEQRARDAASARARAAAQAAPVAEVAHTRGGSSVGVGSKAAAGITVLGASVRSRSEWRRIMAIQAILGPSTSSRDMNGLTDPLRS